MDSDDARSASSRRRHLYPHQYAKRMSLLSTPARGGSPLIHSSSFDFEAGEERTSRTTRRFFHSSAVWDPTLKTVVIHDYHPGAANGNGMNGVRVSDVMDRGGKEGMGGMDIDMDGADDLDGDWRDGDVSISVES